MTGSRGRILFLYSTLTVGGAERQLALLVPGLRERGYEPVVATLRHRGRYFEELEERGVRMIFVGMRSRWDVAGLVRAYRLWRFRPDIVFTSSIDAETVGHAIALRARAKHVTAEHGGAGIPRSLHRRLLARLVAPYVAAVVAVSESQVPELRSLGYPAARISVIPNGIPAPVPGRPAAAVRDELGLGSDDVVAIFVATLRPEKRAQDFVTAVLRAGERAPALRGVVVGGGPGLDEVCRLAATRPGVVHILGERADVADLVPAADVLCLTSTFEGLPMTVLEAFAVSRPVLAMRVGGLPEVVIPGSTGWLVPAGDVDAFADALVALAGDPVERRELGEGARRLYDEQFTLPRMVDRYETLLDGCIAPSR